MTSDAPPDPDTAALVANDPDFDVYVRQQAKRALRDKMRALRASVPAEMRSKRSLAIAQQLLTLPELARASTVLTFLPIKGEPTLEVLHSGLRERGVTLALTRVDPETDTLEVARFDGEDGLVYGSYGLREPPPDAAAVALDAIDVVLVPGLVMDLRGHRIGYGKGHFDRLLVRLPTAFRCGVCYDFQLVGEAPCLPHDVPLHAVVTDQQVVRPDPVAP
ncbi:MAG: 5-formyltetrahydrofolate cyclo-ligase [Sandaracinaceae bacterium]|jgi:5-formyltetrahydrofolate cyclo-ligase|nr:5-formyltetrahydrofolate cyclo-ligase [Sandaracinaceae bacterium]